MADLNYTQLINRVVLDFDKVWTALNEKGNLVSATYGVNNVDTANYGSLVAKLTLVGDGTKGLNSVAYFDSASTKALGTVTVAKSGGKYTVSSVTSDPGYYAAGTNLSGEITATTKDLVSAKAASELILDSTKGVYSLVAQNYVIGEITVTKATSSNTSNIYAGVIAADGIVTEAPLISDVTLENDDEITNVLLDEESTHKVKVKAHATTTGTISAKTVNTTTEGYITATDKAAVSIVSQEIDESANEDITIGIKAGSIAIDSVEGTTITATVNSGDETIFATEGIAITASIDEDSLKGALTATVTEGYVVTGTPITVNDLDTTAGTKYIKVGSSNNQTIDLDSKLGVETGNGYFSESGKDVKISVSDTAKANITSGFIKSADAGTITVEGELNLKLTEGAPVAKWNITEFTPSGNLPTSASGKYFLTVTPTVDVDTAGTTAGWIDGASSITTGMKANSKTAATYYVQEASLNIASEPSFVASFTEFTEGTGTANKPGMGTMTDVGDLFLDDVPTGTDYFTITSGLSYTIGAGYTEGTSGTPTVTRYLKKAVIEHVDGGVDGEDYYQVTSGGYLPSGILSNISTVAPTVADVHVNLVSAAGIVSGSMAQNTTVNDYYEITLAKGSIDAGYISKTKGTVNGKGYIAKGSVSAQATVSATKGNITRKTGENGAVTYEAATTITANPNVSFKAGYVASYTAPEATVETSTYTIDRVTFGATTHTTNASAVSTTVRAADSGETSTYTVAPRIDSCSTEFTVASAGYVSEADADILKFENDGITHDGKMTGFSIHAGGGILTDNKLDSSTDITLTSDFTTSTGTYTVTLGGVAKTTFDIDTGYYGDTESSFENVEVSVSKTLSVARGAVGVTVKGSNAVSSSEVSLHTSNSGGAYYGIGATASANATPAINTPGYVRDLADVNITSATLSANTVYVEAYSGTTRTTADPAPEGTQKFTAIEIGQDADYVIPAEKPTAEVEVVLATAERYAKKDTVVKLSADAMGSNVIGSLLALQARLSGENASIVSI